MESNSKVYIAGHTGLVGSALLRRLHALNYTALITATHDELDLTRQDDVESFFVQHRPDYVFLAAAKVGGIYANDTYRAEFLYENLMIQANVIHAAFRSRVKKLLFFGSNCIYPRDCPQPMAEDYLLTGPLEPTNEPYAVAKIAGIKLCENYNRQYGTHFISVMPACLYGPNDNFGEQSSHVLPALIRKAHEAKLKGNKQLVIWGSGTPKREFLFVEDLVDACLFLTAQSDLPLDCYNIGTGLDISIKELAEIICETVGFSGDLCFDTTKPNGMPRKLLDVRRIRALGWVAKTKLRKGIEKTYEAFLEHSQHRDTFQESTKAIY